MLKKRIIGTITIRNNWAVQSFGYRRYLPLGKPECLAENLDRWGADEIFLQEIDRSKKNVGPNLPLIEKIARCHLSTPITYAGGIRHREDAVAVIRTGAERVCLDNLLHTNPAEVIEITKIVGAQAVVGSFPLTIQNNQYKGTTITHYNYQQEKGAPLSDALLKLIHEGIISEGLVIDKINEGKTTGFNFELLALFEDKPLPLILFGGFNDPQQISQALINDQVAAVAIGNFLNYREHALQNYKQQLVHTEIRPPIYGLF